MIYLDDNSRSEILSKLKTERIGKNLIILDVTGSTNDYLKERGETLENGTVVIAKTQNKGKGTKGRQWASGEGGIWMSYLLNDEVLRGIKSVENMYAYMGLAVVHALETLFGDRRLICGLKPLNDVYINGKKACGILSESSFSGDRINYCVVGIGLNVNNSDFPDELKDIATSICIETGEKTDINAVAAAMIMEIDVMYAKLADGVDISDEYEKYKSIYENQMKK